MAISFQNQDITFRLGDKLRIKAWMKQVIRSEKKTAGDINFVFTSDETVLEANIRFLKHNTYTDIITFDSCEGNIVNGDILISVERVKENAATFAVPFETELRRVLIHGVLHLCGYEDKSAADIQVMREKENKALRKF